MERCSIVPEDGEAVYVYSYSQERGEMMPSNLAEADDPDTVPAEYCCAECANRRHGIDFSDQEVN